MSNDIGSKLKTLRKGKRLTQEQVAQHFGVARGTISNYELGRRKPTIKELQDFAKFYGVGLDFFGFSTTSKDELFDFVSRAKQIFNDDNVSKEEKNELYKQLMKIYLEMSENEW